MSEDEDDYLSDKFLLAAEEPKSRNKPTTYSDIRRQAAKRAEDRNIANRVKSARELREEAVRGEDGGELIVRLEIGISMRPDVEDGHRTHLKIKI